MLWHFLVVMVINLFFQCLHVDTSHAIHFFPVLDQNEGGDVSDPVFLASLTIVTDIHLGENHLIAIIIAAGFPGQLGVLGFNGNAMGTPICAKVHHHQLVSSILDGLVQIARA